MFAGPNVAILALMVRKILHSFIPTSLYRSRTAFPPLSRVDRELATCQRTSAAIDILNRAKPELCTRLRALSESAGRGADAQDLNLFLARYHFRARSASLLSRPFGLVIDPSNVCQLACPGCVHSARNEALQLFDWPKGTLSESRLSALLKRYGPYAIGTLFYNYGEPLLNSTRPS
jgi:hypothetical protein